jgi:hypothetical protein
MIDGRNFLAGLGLKREGADGVSVSGLFIGLWMLCF